MSPRIVKADLNGAAIAGRLVRSGGLVVFPTDTVYGLGCDPRNSDAVSRLFQAKRREPKPIPILCDGFETAASLVVLDGAAKKLAEANWPGALTIVAPVRVELPYPVHQGTGMVGVRVPAHAVCLDLIRICGGSITGTSANLSGRPACRSAEEAISELGEEVDLVLDGGYLTGRESTVVRFGEKGIEVLREGAVRVTDEVEHK
ncbi:MAG TPA: L-threonylcarbamoyladenylate synthase [Nitrososphaerales archaeon]|nr:L-threonylcarbamoyladenylate synthase [Nitrososphaerales archaeon]